ncbi:uncharacterized protein TNCV_122401 [Trichonephila clavipes]|nr:uncharacterized protein TNCV_122401 [Trichonephila clavipes]
MRATNTRLPRPSCATRGLLATDHVILNHGQVTWTTPELALPLPTTTPHQREDISVLDRFNVHRSPKRRVFSDTGLELVTRPAIIRYLDQLVGTNRVVMVTNSGSVLWSRRFET